MMGKCSESSDECRREAIQKIEEGETKIRESKRRIPRALVVSAPWAIGLRKTWTGGKLPDREKQIHDDCKNQCKHCWRYNISRRTPAWRNEYNKWLNK
jgi:hypothetical protein